MRQLSSLDAQFLAIENPRTFGHVAGLAVYDPSTAPGGDAALEDICRMLSERLHLLPPFRWRLVPTSRFGLDHPYWVEDPDFDLDFHIRDRPCRHPATTSQIVRDRRAPAARPLDRRRPLWELYVIKGLAGRRVALLTKVHHAAVDGVSGNEILSASSTPARGPRDRAARATSATAERVPSDLEMLGRGMPGYPLNPLRALRAMPARAAEPDRLPGADAIPGVARPCHAPRGLRRRMPAGASRRRRRARPAPASTARSPRTGGSRSGRSRSTPLRRSSTRRACTVNDVVVAHLRSAVRDWLLERDELPDDPLLAMVPVSVRTEEQRGTFGNRVSTMIVEIPTNEHDPRERLEQTHASLKSAKERHRRCPRPAHRRAPRSSRRRWRRRGAKRGRAAEPHATAANLVISNVPGPREPLYCAGAQLEAIYPVSAILDGVGLNITVMSYRDHGLRDRGRPRPGGRHVGPAGRRPGALDELETAVCGGTTPAPAESARPAR